MSASQTHTPADMQQRLARLAEGAQQAAQQFAQAGGITDFGANAVSLDYLDRFVAQYARAPQGDAARTSRYQQALGCVLGQMLVDHYGGRWLLGKSYAVELRGPDGARRHLFPFHQAGLALTGKATQSLRDYVLGQEAQPSPGLSLVAPESAAANGGAAASAPGLSDEERAEIKARAAGVMEGLDLAMFGYTAEAVACVEQHLEDTAKVIRSNAEREKLARELGSFLGECIIAVYGGHWEAKPDGSPCVTVSVDGKDMVIDPIAVLLRRLRNSSAVDDIHAYFTQTLPLVVLPAAARALRFNSEERKMPGFFTRLLNRAFLRD